MLCDRNRDFSFLAENHGLYIAIVRQFNQISFRIHNSPLEVATELKFVPFYSFGDALLDNGNGVPKLAFVIQVYTCRIEE